MGTRRSFFTILAHGALRTRGGASDLGLCVEGLGLRVEGLGLRV